MSVRTRGKFVVLAALTLLAAAARAKAPTADVAGPFVSPSASASRTAPKPVAPPCAAGQLRVAIATSGVAAGTWSALVTFTNRGATACALHGWPTVRGVTADGRSTRARLVPDYMNGLLVPGVPTVMLAPGDQAGIDVNGGDNPVGDTNTCLPAYQRFRVTAPGTAGSAAISAYLTSLDTLAPSCAGLTVSAVHPMSDLGFNQ